MNGTVIFSIFLIFSGAAILATLALYTRQSLLVAYILLGALLGPYGFRWVNDPDLIKQTGDIGIIFLLFLLGLNLHPQNLLRLLKNVTLITFLSSGIFALIGCLVAYFANYSPTEAAIIGITMMFSSTIIALKLLPTTTLHHQHIGEIVISILLLQDLIAIVALLFFQDQHTITRPLFEILRLLITLPGLIVITFIAERFILIPLIRKFDTVKEYIFLVAIGWCLGMAELAEAIGLSYAVGAFIAGVSIASSPISLFIAESLKPLRDFFLVLFFFSLGAGIVWQNIIHILWLAIILSGLMLLLKPMIFCFLLKRAGESAKSGWEVGFRLGQVSEFSLFIAYLAHEVHLLGNAAYDLIQITTLITFIVSAYLVVLHYPSPIALSERLRRD